MKAAPRSEFDAVAQSRRQARRMTMASAAAPSATADPPPTPVPVDTSNAKPVVIIYGASWCSACHDAAAYLRRKNVPFIEKDIEEDPSAAREMNAKLAKNGLRRGSIPVIDVRGRVMVGFNAREVDNALGATL